MRLGYLMIKALKFIVQCNGWHSFTKDRDTVQPITRLSKLGLVEINQYNMFRITEKGILYLKTL